MPQEIGQRIQHQPTRLLLHVEGGCDALGNQVGIGQWRQFH